MSVVGGRTDIPQQGCDVRAWGPRLCENSDVGLARRKSVSITLNKKRTALAVTVERRKERKQFCAFSARAGFHTAWTPKRTLGRDKLCTNSGHFGKVIFFQRVAQRHRVLVGCAAASMRYHDEIRVFSRLMAKSVVGNNQ